MPHLHSLGNLHVSEDAKKVHEQSKTPLLALKSAADKLQLNYFDCRLRAKRAEICFLA